MGVGPIDRDYAENFYRTHKVQQIQGWKAEVENSVFEQLVFVLNQCSALRKHSNSVSAGDVSDIVRVATVEWYYGIHAAASAMVIASNGNQPDKHTKLAKAWLHNISKLGLICPPFEMQLDSLVASDIDRQVSYLKNGLPNYSLGASPLPQNQKEAKAALVAYLSGCAGWWRDRAIGEIKRSKPYQELGVSGFRTKIAGCMRDNILRERSLGFMHEAYRFRGKANYRDLLYLGYGKTKLDLVGYVRNLSLVLDAFGQMAGGYCSLRLRPTIWNWFLDDLEVRRAFSLSPARFWHRR